MFLNFILYQKYKRESLWKCIYIIKITVTVFLNVPHSIYIVILIGDVYAYALAFQTFYNQSHFS